MKTTPFLILGAGISGIALAAALKKRSIPFVLLESADEPGGRIQSKFISDFSIELGAARLLSAHKRALRLVEGLNLELTEQVNATASIFWKDTFYSDVEDLVTQFEEVDPLNELNLFLIHNGIHNLTDFERLQPIDWDSILFKTWLGDKGIPFEPTKLYFLGDIDLLLDQTTLYEAAFCYLSNMTDTEGKVFRLKNGMLGIVKALIEKYDLEIQFNQKVTRIESSDLGFKVHATSQLYTAENVVVTSSLTSFQNIQLPSQIQQKLEKYLTFGGYGKCIKGYFTLKEGLLSTNFEDYILTDEPFRIIKHSATVFEWYLLSLTKVWEHSEVCDRLHTYFGHDDIKEIVIQDYNDSKFNGCYWVYNKGFFHKIYELKNTVQLGANFYAIGEHFSSNPNWIEGSLESVENLLQVIDSN